VKKLISGKYIRLWLFVLALSRCVLAQVVPVANVEELYSVVNNPANAGATLVLAPGTYWLSATDPYGAPRPNGGRIEFQMDMSLMGVEGNRDAVVISAINLPASSFPATAGPNAAIRMGRGQNAIEWLTVRDAAKALSNMANIDAGLPPADPGGASIVVAHVASTGSFRGLNVTASGSQWVNKTLEADITDSYFFDNVMEGVRAGSLPGADGSIINVRMSGNLSWGQHIGWLLEHNLTSDSTVNAVSSGNRFYANAVGMFLLGALSSTGNSNGNTINYEAHGDQFTENNTRVIREVGGLVVITADNTAKGVGGSNNTVNVSLWGCRMLDNSDTDFRAIASRSNFGPVLADPSLSQNNHITIDIHGDGNDNGRWQPVEFFANSLPGPPDYGNSVTVIE